MLPNILYEDNHIIVAEKPCNIPVQSDSSGDTDMLGMLKEYVRVKYNKPGEAFLGLVHRLDRPVGGVMVFARTSKAASRLAPQFSGHTAKKLYAAVVEGIAPQQQTLCDYMKKDAQNNAVLCKKTDDGAQYAELSYRTVATKNGLSLLAITLKTGRHHQIRAQLKNAGFPIYGDHRYNPAHISSKTQIALHAYSLELEHPTQKKRLRFTSRPQGGAFEPFYDEISALLALAYPVYIDENVLIIDKQVRDSVAIADGGENTLEARLSEYFSFAKPAHRLDSNTTGLIIFARNETALCELEDAIKNRRIQKLYKTTVLGHMPKPHDVLRAYLTKLDDKNRVIVSKAPQDGAKEIVTEYTVLGENAETSELLVNLHTGRTHQIRAHLAFIGHPVLGDDKYGNREFNRGKKCSMQQLRAVSLCFNGVDDASIYPHISYLAGKTVSVDI